MTSTEQYDLSFSSSSSNSSRHSLANADASFLQFRPRDVCHWTSNVQVQMTDFQALEATAATENVETNTRNVRKVYSEETMSRRSSEEDYDVFDEPKQHRPIQTDCADLEDYEYSQLIESSILSITHNADSGDDREPEHRQTGNNENTRPAQNHAAALKALHNLTRMPVPPIKVKKASIKTVEIPPRSNEVDAKLLELDAEIKKYNKHNQELRTLRLQHDAEVERFQVHVSKFESEQNAIISDLAKRSEQERKSLRQERLLSEKHHKLSQQLPSKQERKEIEDLKAKVKHLTTELKNAEIRHSLHQDREHNNIQVLTKKNRELVNEIRILEQDRLNLQSRPVPSVKSPKSPIVGKPVTQSNGHTVFHLPNGDVKTVMQDETVVYYYAESMITQSTFKDGVVIYDFPDGQSEKRHADGSTEVSYPDGTIRYIFDSGDEETVFADGTISRVDCDGRRGVEYRNGTRELYYKQTKQRFEVDGTVRTVFPDGRQETRYPDGTVKVRM